MMPSVRLCARRLALAVLAALVLGTPRPGFTLHRDLPFLLSVTPVPGDNGNGTPARGQPQWIAFESTTDLMHNGSTGREIFLYNSLNDVTANVPVLGQITNFTRDSGNPSVGRQGDVIAFDSAADIRNTGNATRQIFLWTRPQNSFTQLTAGAGTSHHPELDFEAESLVFQSTSDLLNTGSTGNQVFHYNLRAIPPAVPLTQITAVGESFNARLTHDANFVFFDSAAPLTGTSNGFRQIYVWSRLSRQLTRLTNAAGDSTAPSPDGTGLLVAFQSTADLLGTGVAGTQVYFLNRQTGRIRRVTDGPGDSFAPSIGRGDDFVAFLSTGDLLGTGATGTHVFFFDPRIALMYQVTKQAGALGEKVVASGGNFISFVTNEDLLGTGVAGRQTYLLNTWERIPKPFIGERVLNLVPGDGTLGSHVRVTAQDWVAAAGVPVNGRITLQAGTRDFEGEAPITVAAADIRLPPTPIAGFGNLCVTPTAAAQGVFDCDGGREGGDLLITQDHDILDVDPACVQGCVEGQLCQGPLPGPHTGACNETPRIQHVNPGQPGGLTLRLPVRLAVSRQAGVDGVLCTPDDDYAWNNVDTVLEFTSGTATGTILDADATPGANLSVTETGGAFECRRMEQANFAGGALVSVLPLLDLPNTPSGLRDVIVGFRLEPFEGRPFRPCEGVFCKVLTYCERDSQCNDGNICNGHETCFANGCIPGPLVCDDQNACNGQEFCDPLLGCLPAGPLACDDGATCTADACDPIQGCIHQSITGCCVVDGDCADIDACNGAEVCLSGDCLPGAPLTCDDADACNGAETCDAGLGCVAGAPPACDDGAPCTADTCDAALGCVHTSIPGCCTGDADCIDNEACNGAEQCIAGDCVPGTAPTCNDGALCTLDLCDAVVGCLALPIPDCCVSDADCIDNDACNGTESCVAGACLPGVPPVCDDGAPCTADTCDPAAGCVSASIPGCCLSDPDCINNSVCDGVESCLAGDCLPGTPLTCDDGLFCNGQETCDKVAGCQSGTPFDCNDGASCTLDVCDEVQGCLSSSLPGCCATDADCINNNPCDGTESCVAGDCVGGTPLSCDDGNPCNGGETCDPTSGGCVAGAPMDCDDGVACTADSCDAVAGCVHTGFAGCCQTDDQCDDRDQCNGQELCDFTGTCQAGATPAPTTLPSINCDVAAFALAVEGAPDGALGLRRTELKVDRVLDRVRKALSPVNSRGRPKRIGARLAAAMMGRIAESLDRSIARGQAGDFEMAEVLGDWARQIQSNLQHYRVGAPQS
jgi:Tol biopolymer transport system component